MLCTVGEGIVVGGVRDIGEDLVGYNMDFAVNSESEAVIGKF